MTSIKHIKSGNFANIGFFVAGLFIATLSLTGCEEDVVGILGTERPFTLYGVFTPGPDTQWVRVFSIQEKLELIKPEPLDATFISTNLTTNQSYTWRDSITQDERGRYSHIFWAPFSVDYGETHRIEVTRSDGEQSSAQVKIPLESELIELDPEVNFRTVTQPVLVSQATDRLIRMEISYKIINSPSAQGSQPDIVLSYDGQQRMTPDGWVVDVKLSDDIRVLREELAKTGNWFPSFGVGLTSMTLQLMVVDDAWNPPDGTFNPEVLVQPGTLSNVENGFGFVGAGYRLDTTWRPPETALQQAGFRPGDDGDDEEEEPDPLG